MEGIHFSGRMRDVNFLSRLYDLKTLPSSDFRFEDVATEIKQHSFYNNDYERNWVFDDERFELLNGSNEIFLKFICEMAHPLVRSDASEAKKIALIANDWLREDGWELYPIKEIAGGKVLSFRETNVMQKPKEDEVAHIWEPNKLKFFISHRDIHKVAAKKLGEDLTKYGISTFVAHDSIQAMSTWKHEIMRALQTMDACLCFITSDFYDSEWTNQEVGFALARGIPIYLYSVDRTDPKGFKLDIQAIKSGISELVNCIKKDFSNNTIFKKNFIQNFVAAKDGTFDRAKEIFFDLIDLSFNNDEIEKIAKAFSEKAKYINQLSAILYDQIKEEHKKHPSLRTYTHYREYLDNDIFNRHSTKRFKVRANEDGRVSIQDKIEL